MDMFYKVFDEKFVEICYCCDGYIEIDIYEIEDCVYIFGECNDVVNELDRLDFFNF